MAQKTYLVFQDHEPRPPGIDSKRLRAFGYQAGDLRCRIYAVGLTSREAQSTRLEGYIRVTGSSPRQVVRTVIAPEHRASLFADVDHQRVLRENNGA